ncbi:MAG: hypothetical protein HQ583_06495 [Candidatus Abyssubacteria bacterium]|nr:hypothetical protein [Candidatus Abyssubacteria bacterium]
MGDPEHFYRPDKWNPDGYLEQIEIHAINIPLVNGPWWKFAYFSLPSTKTIMKRAEKRADQIRQTGIRYKNRVVKEARFCLTLPAWLRYGPRIDGVLVCLREPIQAARSIQKRNFTTIKHALDLWYIHNTRLLENAEGIPTWFVYYNNVLNESLFLQEMKGAFHFFGYELADDELKALRKKCVKPEMNHFPEKPARYPHKIEALWEQLLRRHEARFESV